MAKPDLLKALVKPSGELVGDPGVSSQIASQGIYHNVSLELTPAISGTITYIDPDTEILILTPNTGIGFVPLRLPAVSGSNAGKIFTVKNQQETGVNGPALRFFPTTGDRIEALDVNEPVDFGLDPNRGPVSVTFINTGSSWDILYYHAGGAISFP